MRAMIAATIASALIAGGCAAEVMPADGVDISLQDVAPDASALQASPMPIGRRAATRPMVAAPQRTPQRTPPRIDDRAHVAGPIYTLPSDADPVAHKRQFFLAWVRVSMPTGGPGAPGTVSAVFTPKASDEGDYWKVTDSTVLCPDGKPSVRGTNLAQIDCGGANKPN